ncbi:MAG: gliding motility-associated C-terminal domain-containing protein [Bacteroidota bacterium]
MFIFILFVGSLLFGSFEAKGQDNIRLKLDNTIVLLDQLVVCGNPDEQRVVFAIDSDNPNPRTNIRATLNLFAGVQFVELDTAASSTGVTLIDNSNPSQPIFAFPNLDTTNTDVAIAFSVRANCTILAAAPDAQVADDWSISYDLSGANFTESFTGVEYKDALAVPNLNLELETFPQPFSIGDEVQRTVTISNSGLNSYLSEFSYQVLPEDGLVYQSILVNGTAVDFMKTINGQNDTMITAMIDGTVFINNTQEFGLPSNGNALFDADEIVTITEVFRVVSCGADGNATLETMHNIRWGCDDAVCREEIATTNISVGTGEELIQFIYNEAETVDAGYCDAGNLSITVSNNGFEFDDGFGTIRDIAAGVGFAVGADFLSADQGYEITSITIGNSAPINAPNGLIQLNDNPAFSTDPDGEGGLEDFDNDGFFDDLRVGESFTMTATFAISCSAGNTFNIEEGCDNDFRGNFDGKIEYANACGGNNQNLFDNFYRSSNSGTTRETCADPDAFNDNGQFTVIYAAERRMSNFTRSCQGNDEVRVTITVPDGITLSNLTNLQQDTTKYAATIQNAANESIMTFDASPLNLNNDYQINFVFNTECTATGPTAFPVDITYFCPDCNCSHIWYCGVLEGATLHDRGAPCSDFVCENGLQTTSFEVERTTFGFTDANFNTPFNPDLANKKVALGCDSVEMKMTTVVGNTPISDSLGLVINYGSVDGQVTEAETFLFSFAEIIIRSGGNTRTCTIDTTNFNVEFSGENKEMYFDLSGCFNGETLDAGDEIDFVGHFAVNPEGGLPNNTFKKVPEFRARGYAIRDGVVHDGCDTYGELFRLANLTTTFSGPSNSTYPTGCEDASLVYTISKSINANAMRQFFGEEHRQAVKVDSLKLVYDPNFLTAFEDISVDYRVQGNQWIPLNDLATTDNGVYQMGFSFLSTASTITGSNQVFQFRINATPSCAAVFGSQAGNDLYDMEAQINYQNRFFASTSGNADCVEIKEDTDKRTIQYQEPPQFSLEGVVTDVQSAEDVFQWTVEHCNTSFVADAGLTFIQLEEMSGNVEVLFIEDISDPNSIDTLTIQQFGASNTPFAFANGLNRRGADANPADFCNIFRITAQFANCGESSVAARIGWNCNDYDDPNWNPTLYPPCEEESILLKAATLDPFLSASFQEDASTISGVLCDTSTMIILVRNEEAGNAYDVRSQIILPTGATLLTESVELAYPSSADFRAAFDVPSFVEDSELGSIYQYDNFENLNTFLHENGLPAFSIDATDSSEFRLKYRFITNCDYQNGELNRYSFQGFSACGDSTNTAAAETNPIIFQADPSVARTFTIELTTDQPISTEQSSTIEVSIENTSANLSENDKVEIALPAGISYVPNSVNATTPNSWTPDEPTIRDDNGTSILNLILPAGIGQGQRVIFQIQAIADSLNCDSTFVSRVATTSTIEFTCQINGESCVYDFSSSNEAAFVLPTTCEPTVCTLAVGKETSTLLIPDCSDSLTFCFDQYTPEDIENYTITDNGVLVDTANYRVCNFEQTGSYTYAQINNVGGDIRVDSWTVDGVTYSGLVGSIFDLADSMSVWDVDGNWEVFTEGLVIQGGHLNGEYSRMEISIPDKDIRSSLSYDTRLIPTGLSVLLAEGIHELVILDGNNCVDTLLLDVIGQDCPTCTPAIVDNIIVENANCEENNGTATINLVQNPADYIFNWSPDIGTGQHRRTGLATASYFVQIIDRATNECFETVLVNVGNADGPKATFVKTNTDCNTANGTVQLIPNNWTYTWSDGSTEVERTDLAEGRYIITVTDENNPDCTNLLTVEIEGINSLTVGHTVFRRPNCLNNNGVVAIDVEGGSGQYTTTFPDGSLAQTNLSEGTYEITVTDDLTGCFASYLFSLNGEIRNGNITITDFQDLNCRDDQDGSITFEVDYQNGFRFPADTFITDGLRFYENGQLPAGNYLIFLQDGNGCVAGSRSFEIKAPPILSANISKEGDCTVPQNIFLNVEGGTPAYLFDWADVSGALNDQDRIGLEGGTYTVVVTDALGCSINLSIELDTCDCTLPTFLNPIVSPATCGEENGGFVINLDQNLADYTFLYEPELGQTGETSNIRTALPAGDYQVTVAFRGDTTCTDVINITVPDETPAPVEATVFPSICAIPPTGTAVLTPANYTYVWPDGFVGNNRNQLAGGIYEVTFTDPSLTTDCGNTVNVEILVNSNLTASAIIANMPTCAQENGTVALNVEGGSGNYSFSWNSETNVNNTLAAGDYEVTVFDATEGCQTTVNFSLESAPVGVTTIDLTDTVEVACNEEMNGRVDFTLSFSDDIQLPLDTIITDGIDTFENGQLPVGEYCLQINDANGCLTGETCFIIGEAAPLMLVYEPVAACADTGGISLAISGGIAPYAVDWADLAGADNEINRIGLDTGLYEVTITDANGCVEMASIRVPECDACLPPTIAEVSTTFSNCTSNTGSIFIRMEEDERDYDFFFMPDLGQAFVTGNIRAGLPVGKYRILIVFKANPSCRVEVEAEIEEKNFDDLVPITSPADCGLANGQALLVPETNTYTWPDGFIGNARSDLRSGFYQVRVRDEEFECDTEIVVRVEERNLLQAKATVDTPPTCGNADGAVTINVNGGSGDYRFNWAGNTNTQNNLSSGTYSVLIVDNRTGCQLPFVFSLIDAPSASTPITIEGTTNASCPLEADGSVDFTVNLDNAPDTPLDTIFSNGQSTFQNNRLPQGAYCLSIVDTMGCAYGQACFTIGAPDFLVVETEIIPECDEGGSISVFVEGGTNPYTFDWADVDGFADQADRFDLDAGFYRLTVTDANGCQAIFDTLQVAVCEPCPLVVGMDTIYYNLEDCSVNQSICLDYDFDANNPFLVTLNGAEIDLFDINSCGADTIETYTTETLLGLGRIGQYTVTSWPVNDQIFSGDFNSIEELVDTMNIWDPSGNWVFSEDGTVITGGASGSIYGPIDAIVQGTPIESFLGQETSIIQRGISTDLGVGVHTMTVQDPKTFCEDTVIVVITCAKIDTTEVITHIRQLDTFCLPTNELAGNLASIELNCGNGDKVNASTVQDSCVTIEGVAIGLDTICAVLCDDLGVCDTTIFTINIQYDTIQDVVLIEDTTTFCLDTIGLSLDGTIQEMQEICRDTNDNTLTNIEFDIANKCIIYTGKTIGAEKACIEICDDLGICDTIIFTLEVRNNPPDRIVDTVFVGETITYCFDSLIFPNTITYFENECPENSGENVDFFLDPINYCVEYTGVEVGQETACIVLCDENNICDTAFFDITVAFFPDLPIANDDVDTTDKGVPIVLNVKENDIPFGVDEDGLNILDPPLFGEAIPNLDGSITYFGDEFCEREDLFTYTLCNPNGCDTATVRIYIECVDIVIFTAVSPNRDGINDVFYIAGIEKFPSSELKIYNRWGNIVLQTLNYQNDWRGTWKNDLDLPDGTYFYQLELNDPNDDRMFEGFFELHR